MKEEKIITIVQYHDAEKIDDLEAILYGGKECHHRGQERFSASFDNGVEMDVTVVFVPDEEDDRALSYVDSVLYVNGNEVSCGDISESLENIEFMHEYDGVQYVFIIKKLVNDDG